MQEAVVVQVIVDVRDENGEGDAAPQLLDVLLRGRAEDADGVDHLGVRVLGVPTGGGPHERGGGEIHQTFAINAVEAADGRPGDALASPNPAARRPDGGGGGWRQAEDPRLRD